jgi:3-deoxy-D-manno-octulosonic-acid transferase
MIFRIRLLYNLLFPVVLILMLPGFALRMIRRGKYRHKFWQRFAMYSDGVDRKIAGTGRLWIHAVSVGEVNIALKLIQTLRERDASLEFVLSTTTSTGFKLAATRKTTWLEPIYSPLDFQPIARRAMRLIRPRALVLVEAEVWPNCVCEAKSLGIPIILVNARLSPRSEKRFRKIRWIAAPVFNQIDILCLQEPADEPRWRSLGVDPSKLHTTGSIKFDDSAAAPRPIRDFRPALDSLGISPHAPVLLGGSTFEGEELLLAEVFLRLRKSHPNLFLILVPRHQERSDSVANQLEQIGLRLARRTEPGVVENPDALLVDTTGELASWYRCATVVFIGKSLMARGGQNPAEAIAAGAPVVFGPNMQNFASLAAAFLRAGGAAQISDAGELQEALDTLLQNPRRREESTQAAQRCLEIHRGATARTIDLLQSLLQQDQKNPSPSKNRLTGSPVA